MGVHGSAWKGVHGFAGVCMGVHGAAWVRMSSHKHALGRTWRMNLHEAATRDAPGRMNPHGAARTGSPPGLPPQPG
eukprot:350193-Chlamydomonas_euryale.AAC.14